MFTVTASAGGTVRDAGFQRAAMNGILVFILDAGMALTTGIRDIGHIDLGAGITGAFQGMVAVAIEAGGGFFQTSADSLSMH